MAGEKRVISNDEFLNYKSISKLKDDDKIYFCFIKEIYGLSNSEMVSAFGFREDELPDENVTSSDLLEKYPERIREVYEVILQKFRGLNYSLEQFVDFVMQDNFRELTNEELTQIEQYFNEEKDKVIEILNNSDLTQVLPESFYDFDLLKSVNLEGSGAKLDMDKFTTARVSGSIKGCELISYNRNIHFEGFNDSWGWNTSWEQYWKKYLDESQKMQFLKGSIKSKYVPDGIVLTNEEHIQLLEDYQDFFSRDDLNSSQLVGLLRLLPEDLTNNNQAWVEKTLKYVIEDGSEYQLFDIIKHANVGLLKKYLKDIIKYFENSDNKERRKKAYSLIWSNIKDEDTQIGIIDDIFEELSSNPELNSEDKREIDADLLECSKGKKVIKKIVDKHRDDEGKIKPDEILFKEYIMLTDEESAKEVLNRHEEVYGLDILYEKIQHDLVFKDLPLKIQEHLLEKFLDYGSEYQFNNLYIKSNVNKNTYDNLLRKIESDTSKYSKSFYHNFRGQYFFDNIINYSDEELLDSKKDIMKALIEKYNLNDMPNINEDFLEGVSINYLKALLDIEKYTEDVNGKTEVMLNKDNVESILNKLLKLNDEELKVLSIFTKEKAINKSNFESTIESIPILGTDIVYRVINSNSRFISKNSSNFLKSLVKEPEKAIENLERIENIFFKRDVPNFIKIYKYFEILGYDESKIDFSNPRLSQALLNSKSRDYSKRIIFSDLLRIAMDSNSRTLRDCVKTLKEGNEIYTRLMINGADKNDLSNSDRQKALKYINTIYSLYELSDAKKIDDRSGKQIRLTGNIKKDFELLGKRYSHDGKIKDLPDRVLKQFIGPYQDLFEGIDTIDKIEEYMETRKEESNERRFRDTKSKILLEPGDMIHASTFDMNIFSNIIEDGLRAGEFLGFDHHSDGTPLDTDFSVILPGNTKETLEEVIIPSTSAHYGGMVFVLKGNKDKIEFSRKNDDLEIDVQEGGFSQRVEKRLEKEGIKQNVNSRISGKYEKRKLEAFSSSSKGDHYGIRTGVGSLDIDYIIIRGEYDKRIGYELAMNGIYIPVYESKTGNLVFTPEDYKKIRDKMKGLSYYDSKEFEVSQSTKTVQAKEIVDDLFQNDNVDNSKSEIIANRKRSAIEKVVEKVLREKMGLGMENHITGDMTEGFVEFIDTGSTGRGTNLPNSGDFDFMLKVDNRLMQNSEMMKKLKDELSKVLAVKSDDPDCEIVYTDSGDFRFKKVKIEGEDELLDIDVTFASKDEELYYSTDMCVRERLDNLKKTNPEGYKYTIANIILAKRMLKERGLYKKVGSDDATEYGGFGGVGVENWILQNNGSLVDAIDSFLSMYEDVKMEFPDNKEEMFKRSMEKYPIFDFGENHKKNKYRHDSYIRGLSKDGYFKFVEEIRKIKKELEPIKTNENEPKRPIVTPKIIAEADRDVELTASEKENAQNIVEERLKEEKIRMDEEL